MKLNPIVNQTLGIRITDIWRCDNIAALVKLFKRLSQVGVRFQYLVH